MLALLISLILHTGVALLTAVAFVLGLIPHYEPSGGGGARTFLLAVKRDQSDVPKAPEDDPDSAKEDQLPPVVKTHEDQESAQAPDDPHYASNRQTRAEGGPKAPDDIKEMPAQDGEKPKGDEIVLFDQSRRDGDIEHERDGNPANPSVAAHRPVEAETRTDASQARRGDPSLADAVNAVMITPPTSLPEPVEQNIHPESREYTPNDMQPLVDRPRETPRDRERDPVAEELALADADEPREVEGDGRADRTADETKEDLLAAIRNTAPMRDLMPNTRTVDDAATGGAAPEFFENAVNPQPAPNLSPAALARAIFQQGGGSPADTRPKPAYYDPAFTPEAQPGFRTEEKKTRTTGRFSFGRKAALNVAATPMGRYQMVIYRAIAMCWYKQCDLNRDLIVPGTLHIRLLVDKKGKVADLRLLKMTGASTVQKSFTFLAIQQAPIPAMPPEAEEELVGDKLELYFDFHF